MPGYRLKTDAEIEAEDKATVEKIDADPVASRILQNHCSPPSNCTAFAPAILADEGLIQTYMWRQPNHDKTREEVCMSWQVTEKGERVAPLLKPIAPHEPAETVR